MRLHVLSDLHVEFGPLEVPAVAADVVILAGDIHVGVRGVEWAARRFAGRPVIYVIGNHELYGQTVPAIFDKLKARGATLGLTVLSNETFVVGGVRFLGTSLWTDFRLLGEAAEAYSMDVARQRMLDYRKVRVAPEYRRLRPLDTVAWHARSRRWLEQELAAGFHGPTVVVTHHAPSDRSLKPEFVGDEVSPAYASALDEMVAGSGAVLWVHGHTHRCVDYVIGGTRVVSNQRGYVDELAEGFRAGLVVEV